MKASKELLEDKKEKPLAFAMEERRDPRTRGSRRASGGGRLRRTACMRSGSETSPAKGCRRKSRCASSRLRGVRPRRMAARISEAPRARACRRPGLAPRVAADSRSDVSVPRAGPLQAPMGEDAEAGLGTSGARFVARSRVGHHRGESRGGIPGPNGFSRLRALPGRARSGGTRAPARAQSREAHVMEWGLRCILSKVFDSVVLLGYMYQLARVSEEHGGVKARREAAGPRPGAARAGPRRVQVSYAYDLLLRQKVAKDLEHGDEASTAAFTVLSWDILRAAKVRCDWGGGRAGNANRAARPRRGSSSRTARRRSPRAGARRAAATGATRRARARAPHGREHSSRRARRRGPGQGS